MNNVIAPPEHVRKELEEKQKAFIEKCKEEDRADPPKNLAHKIGRTVWRILTFPTGPTY